MASQSKNGRDSGIFCRFANYASQALGSVAAFGVAIGVVVVWGMTGPVFDYSDTWQLVINTGTTIVTFLMVFLIQNTQNRDSAATQLKLDELIRSTQGAHNALLDLEKLSAHDLEEIRALYQKLAEKARRNRKGGWGDTGTPEVKPRKVRASNSDPCSSLSGLRLSIAGPLRTCPNLSKREPWQGQSQVFSE